MNKSKKLLIYSICFLLSIAFIAGVFLTSNNIVVQANFDEEIKYRSAVLLERNSGKVLVEDKAHDDLQKDNQCGEHQTGAQQFFFQPVIAMEQCLEQIALFHKPSTPF